MRSKRRRDRRLPTVADPRGRPSPVPSHTRPRDVLRRDDRQIIGLEAGSGSPQANGLRYLVVERRRRIKSRCLLGRVDVLLDQELVTDHLRRLTKRAGVSVSKQRERQLFVAKEHVATVLVSV